MASGGVAVGGVAFLTATLLLDVDDFTRRTLFSGMPIMSPRMGTGRAMAFHLGTPGTRGIRVANSFLPAGRVSAPIKGCSTPKITSLIGSSGKM